MNNYCFFFCLVLLSFEFFNNKIDILLVGDLCKSCYGSMGLSWNLRDKLVAKTFIIDIKGMGVKLEVHNKSVEES